VPSRAGRGSGHRHGAGPLTAPALQPERTALAWSRTSLGLLANGVLLILGRFRASRPGVVDGLAAVALLLALAVGLAARRRSRELRRQPAPVPLAVPLRVAGLGVAVAAFCLLTGVALLL